MSSLTKLLGWVSYLGAAFTFLASTLRHYLEAKRSKEHDGESP